jgi:hypothetical protein
LQKIRIDDYAMGTIKSAKKERRRPEIFRPRFLSKGIVSLYEKLFSINPAPILEPPQVSAPIGTANPTFQNRCEAFLQLKYTYYFHSAKMDAAEIFLSRRVIPVIIIRSVK